MNPTFIKKHDNELKSITFVSLNVNKSNNKKAKKKIPPNHL